jgi:N-methylhydantoinase A/acetophenone carboxylase
MMRIGVDVGGTFTDFCMIGDDGRLRVAKTPTTHYDLSVGFMKGLQQLARGNGSDLRALLAATESIRYSTTVGTNALLERNGPKLGLITTAGFEDTIFIGRARSWADGGSPDGNRNLARIRKPEPLIAPDMVVGVRARMDGSGRAVAPLDRDDVLQQLQALVDRGAMGFVVCLLWSFVNPQHEREVKRIIEEEYPEDFLGAMPVFLSSDISPKGGEYTRLMTAIVNAYIHSTMADELNRLGNDLRDAGFQRPLVLVHNTGGTKKLARTRAVLTHSAGPVAGLSGAALLGSTCGEANIVFTDMGGTSFDIGVIADGQVRTQDFIPVIDRWRTNIPAVEVKSIGAGGGSIAWVNRELGNALEVGPRSAGSMPGPACYDQGGSEPTVTDADVVLGYYNPDNYLGGDLVLDPELAREAIQEHVATPLGIPLLEAAWRIRRLVDAKMGQEVFNEVALKGHDPRRFTVFAGGGAGAAHACGIAPHIGAGRILVPAIASVSGAFGAATMRVSELWEKSRRLRIFDWATQKYCEDVAAFNDLVRELIDLATRDLRLEGYADEAMRFDLDLEMRFGSQYNLTRIRAPRLQLESADDFRVLGEHFVRRYGEIYSPEATFLAGGINIESFCVTAGVAAAPFGLAAAALHSAQPPAAAGVGSRPACWHPAQGCVATPVYDLARLQPGNVVAGPAIIEARETTYVIEPGWSFRMDAWRNGVLEARAA